MKKREPVSHIMTPDPYVLNLNDGLSHAEILFKKHTVRHLPVVSGDEIVGILSRTDLARISFVDSYDPNDFSIDTSFAFAQKLKRPWNLPVCLQRNVFRTKPSALF